jgi:hypothetical protein
MRLQAIPPFRRRILRLVPVTVYYGGCSALNYTGVGRFRSGAQANAPASTDNPGRRASDWHQPNAAPGGLPVTVSESTAGENQARPAGGPLADWAQTRDSRMPPHARPAWASGHHQPPGSAQLC